jgi:hypothetical protein
LRQQTHVGTSREEPLLSRLEPVARVVQRLVQRAQVRAVVLLEEHPAAREVAVADGLVTRETCLGLLTCFEDATDLMSMAQFMITAGFCDDVVRLQRLVDQASGASLTGQWPYPSVFAASRPP